MSELLDEEFSPDQLLDEEDRVNNPNSRINYSRPSLAQVKVVVAFMEKNPEFANKKQRLGSGHSKYKRFWLDLSKAANSIEGSVKSSKGWLKFWSDKKRFTMTKQRKIEEGSLKTSLTLLEQKILKLSETKLYTPRKKKVVKQEPCNGDDDSFDFGEDISKGEDLNEAEIRLMPTEAEERQLAILENMVGVMGQQASAMGQIAQASLTNSKAMESIAEASQVQALAVHKLVSSFETVSATAHDIRNAILGIDYTLKRCYPNSTRQNLTNSTLFS